MTRKAAILPPTEPARLLREDEIEDGRRPLFPGHSDFLQLMCCVMPTLVLFYTGAVALSIGSVGSIVGYVRSGLRSTSGSVGTDHLLTRSLRPLLMLVPIGFLYLIVNMISSTGECINHVIQTTIATVQADSTWQWLWVILSCCASAITTLLLVHLQPHRIPGQGGHSQTQWSYLIGNSHGTASKQAIEAWRLNVQALKARSLGSIPRVLISWLLHLPVLCIAVAPSAGYVLAMNVPAGSAWYITILGNPLVVTSVKLFFSEFVFPQLSLKLVRFKFDIKGSAVISSYKLAVEVHQTQANSVLIFDFASILLAPMIAVFVLDEACLRHYLAFADNLRSIMTTWSIGDQGPQAYRHQFCSRTLITQFTWVWLQFVALRTFLTPGLHLAQAHPRLKQMKATLTAKAPRLCRGDSEELALGSSKQALKEAEERKEENVDTYLVLLALIAFGSLCPLLFLMAPIFVVANLCSICWVKSQNQDTYLQRLADKIVVQHPTRLFSLCAFSIQWSVAIGIFIDLEFPLGPVAFYCAFWALHLGVVIYCWPFCKRCDDDEPFAPTSNDTESGVPTLVCFSNPTIECLDFRQY